MTISGRLAVFLVFLSITVAGEPPAWTGYRGPAGTGVFPASNPPIDCDMATGRNIAWRAPLPNWGHGCPVVVRDRAFVLSEPGWKHDWPVLTCIDTGSGKVLWEREINHLPATGLTPERQAEVAQKWREFQAEYRALYTIFAETVGQGDQEAAKRRFQERGYTFGGHRGGGYGQLRSLNGRPKLHLRDAGLRSDVWRHDCGLGFDEIGAAYASPVSDGIHVFVIVSRCALAAFDRDGKQLWLTYLPFPPQLSGYNETNGRSPILYQDLVITDHPGYTVGVDKSTGAVRWRVDTFGTGHGGTAIITVSGTDYLLTEGRRNQHGGLYAIRLPDGKPTPLAGWGDKCSLILVDTDQRDVAYFCGGAHGSFNGKEVPEEAATPAWKHPAAVRFALEGDRLVPQVLWDAARFGDSKPPDAIDAVYHQGRLYTNGSMLDAKTGEVLAGTAKDAKDKGRPVTPKTRHLLLLAGDRLYGLDGHTRLCDGPPPAGKPAATLTCMDLDGKVLGTSALTLAAVDGTKREQIRSQVGWDRWGFGYGMPFTIAGDCLYLRSSDEVICVAGR
jgi:hypothetical protein